MFILVVDDHKGHVCIVFIIQLLLQFCQAGSLQQAQVSACLKKCHNGDCSICIQHGIMASYLPVGWFFAQRSVTLALCSSPREKAESQGKSKAFPHGGASPAKDKHMVKMNAMNHQRNKKRVSATHKGMKKRVE